MGIPEKHPEDEIETKAALPAFEVERGTAARPQTGRGASTNLNATTVYVLRNEEAARASSFGGAIAILCASVFIWVLFLESPPWLRLAMGAALTLTGSVAVFVWLRARDPTRYGLWTYRTFLVTCVLGSIVFTYFVGVFSPVPLVVTLGLSFFGQTSDRRFVIGGAGAAIVAYLVLAALITLRVIPDLGLFAPDVPLIVRVFIVLTVPFIYCITLWLALASRTAIESALQRANKALALARRREAQLEEAWHDLDELRGGAGLPGRYTGARAGELALGNLLGRGGMGEVYDAWDEQNRRAAAVKVMRADAADEPEMVTRFRREAEIAGRLLIPQVVSVSAVGELEDGTPFLAMEKLEGHDLAWHMRQRDRLPLSEVVHLVEEVAIGLEAAHAAGIVHRDLKPQNLFYAELGETRRQWKILDFGVSKLRGGAATANLTQDRIIGSPAFMSPEQALGREADPRSDVFSLGVVAYRVLTGRPAFSGPDVPQLLFSVVYGSPTRPGELVSGLPEDVELALALGLAKQPEDRLASAAALARALAAAGRGALEETLRMRARRLIADCPWGVNRLEDEARKERERRPSDSPTAISGPREGPLR